VFVILAHERRRITHIAVTDHPKAAWTAQQLREAFPWDDAPKFLIHDRDTAFHAWATTAPAIGTNEVITAVRSPWQNAYAERLIGSIRRECLEITSSSATSAGCAASCTPTSRTIYNLALTCRSTRMHRSRDGSHRARTARS
jgi:transposase InsO family protein